MLSKMEDEKYLTVETFLRGIELTKLPTDVKALTMMELHRLEYRLLAVCGLSLSHNSFVSVLDLYEVYFEVLASQETRRFGVEKCKKFGQYLAALAQFYPTSFYEFGINKMAAACLLLVIRICGFEITWKGWIVDLTGLSKEQVTPAASKLCQKYIDLSYNEHEGKQMRLGVLEFKYSENKYKNASAIRPKK